MGPSQSSCQPIPQIRGTRFCWRSASRFYNQQSVLAFLERIALITKYRVALTLFMAGLVLSGVTAFPLAWEIRLLTEGLGINTSVPPETHSGMTFWLASVDRGLHETYAAYPWMAYGTDWLAFAHVVIAVFFIGPLVKPVRNEWVIYAGLTGCLLVVPLALICGPLRGIPVHWRLIDCSFGVLGAVPLLYCAHLTRLMRRSVGRSEE